MRWALYALIENYTVTIWHNHNYTFQYKLSRTPLLVERCMDDIQRLFLNTSHNLFSRPFVYLSEAQKNHDAISTLQPQPQVK